jgi:D-alanyl-D-alanine carboxypeptidase (penicillin-binding protein 5/6)
VKVIISMRSVVGFLFVLAVFPVAAGAALETKARDPYAGAIVVAADTGRVLFEDAADREVYPASVVKLMNMLVILEQLEAGRIRLDERVVTPAQAARMGGSQVYLAENEVFTVEDLLYALMIQSANDAAMALALHVGGSKEAFVALMNRKAEGLGMTRTRFHSPHGLPPSGGQQPDVTTARDIAILARAVLGYPEVLRYTSAQERPLRGGKFIMRSHNRLLRDVTGCDGLKTGYYSKAGYSIAATAKRDGARVISVVLGSSKSRTRDARAASLIEIGFERLAELETAGDASASVTPGR